jgi:hypothetical protein
MAEEKQFVIVHKAAREKIELNWGLCKASVHSYEENRKPWALAHE